MTFTCSRDRCDRRADAAHIIDEATGGYPGQGPLLVTFSCPAHGGRGYWLKLTELETEPERWREHLRDHEWGSQAIVALVDAGVLEPGRPSRRAIWTRRSA